MSRLVAREKKKGSSYGVESHLEEDWPERLNDGRSAKKRGGC